MNAGLPGTGIGGLFYIAGALWMPFDAAYRQIRGRERGPGWQVVAVQSGIALAILAVLWLTAWTIGYLATQFTAVDVTPGIDTGTLVSPSEHVESVIRRVVVLGSVGVLMVILAFVQLLRTVVGPGRVDASRREGDEADDDPPSLASKASRSVREAA